jgi:hypothetical protein
VNTGSKLHIKSPNHTNELDKYSFFKRQANAVCYNMYVPDSVEEYM